MKLKRAVLKDGMVLTDLIPHPSERDIWVAGPEYSPAYRYIHDQDIVERDELHDEGGIVLSLLNVRRKIK